MITKLYPPLAAAVLWEREMEAAAQAARRGDDTGAQAHALRALALAEEIHADENAETLCDARPYVASLVRLAAASTASGQRAAGEALCRTAFDMALEFEGSDRPSLRAIARTVAMLMAMETTPSLLDLARDCTRASRDASLRAEFGMAAYLGGDPLTARALLAAAVNAWLADGILRSGDSLVAVAGTLAAARRFPFDGDQSPVAASRVWLMPGLWMEGDDALAGWNNLAILSMHDPGLFPATACMDRARAAQAAVRNPAWRNAIVVANYCQHLLSSYEAAAARRLLEDAIQTVEGQAPLLELRLAMLLAACKSLAREPYAALETVWEKVIETEDVADPCESAVARLAICQTAWLASNCNDWDTARSTLALLPPHTTTAWWLLGSPCGEEEEKEYDGALVDRACEMIEDLPRGLTAKTAAAIIASLHSHERYPSCEAAIEHFVGSGGGALRSIRGNEIAWHLSSAGRDELANSVRARIRQEFGTDW